jgi:hypothetical protein
MTSAIETHGVHSGKHFYLPALIARATCFGVKWMNKEIPTMEEVITCVGESLSCLDKTQFRIETEKLGANFHFNVYLNDEWLGTYRIKPGGPGGSMQCVKESELVEKWIWIVTKLIWGDLQHKFGKFPWIEKPNLRQNQKKAPRRGAVERIALARLFQERGENNTMTSAVKFARCSPSTYRKLENHPDVDAVLVRLRNNKDEENRLRQKHLAKPRK